MIFQSPTFIGLFDHYNVNEVNTMSTQVGRYLSLVSNDAITISIVVRSLEIRLQQHNVNFFLRQREYMFARQNDSKYTHKAVPVHRKKTVNFQCRRMTS